ncbi:MAG: alcohol dehydrogenase catalytic domain-containing protein [Actinobacteria bacterium]|nr:alcohol dehydrogenase catalytic domain-containing protein [Actinomycetota bacterium]MCG2802501.1 alcohol dehydrogenase catalytic domain-containing protein [Cellulomonas sp.]
MRAVVVSALDTYSLTQRPDATLLAPTDALVKVRATTVSGSDAHLIAGHLGPVPTEGFPLGHELVGDVVEVGAAVLNLSPGDRVAVPAAPWCGTCARCRAGQIQLCLRGGIFGAGPAFGGLGGAQAELVRVPWADTCLSVVPDGVSDAQALTVGDILSTGWTAVREAVSTPGQTLLVFGAGPVGLSAVHTARLHGVAQVITVDTVADRLALARTLGADHVIDPSTQDVAAVVASLTDGRGAQAVVDAAGVPATIGAWAAVAAVGARIAMVGMPAGPVEMALGALQMKNISVWTGLGDLGHMDMLLAMIVAGRLDPAPIFTETVPFDRIETAIAQFIARKPGLVKQLVTVG